MQNWVVVNISEGTSYVFMENGKSHCGVRDVPRFDEETAKTIERQLPSFDGASQYKAMELLSVEKLIEKFKTQKAIADAMQVSPSVVSYWKKLGHISPKHLLGAHRLLQE